MTYDDYKNDPLNTGDSSRILPTYFPKIDNQAVYSPKEIADIIGVHEETIRRWCRKGELRHEGLKHYKIRGIEIKRKIFSIYKKRFKM
ncbi:helix-turn-helix domain-containing protein [Neobacillus sp. SuZ13]|uniref:helix-turn-helix domain-containing protein n=1 Tax=Neobacillus sp. SuZ13 TaxID=3047875 RepID=UPI0024C020A1|nr:helix-turn-helix domain-containing protein [Neobacillus sp. SuZ13]WHY65376.1 helix-turn-helix domain-containing protein [Neobacillus sp. SuZ13]